MALPTFVNVGTSASALNAISPGIPASIANNDILLLFVESANEAVTAPTGYTQFTNSPQSTGTAGAAGGVRLSVFWKRTTGSESAPTVADTGDHQFAQIMAVRGCKSSGNPFSITPAGGVTTPASTTISATGVTTTAADSFIVIAAARDVDVASTTGVTAVSNASLGSLTERIDQTVTVGQGGGLYVATGTKATAGATGTTTITQTSSIAAWMTIALDAEAVTGTLGPTESGSDTATITGGPIVSTEMRASEGTLWTPADLGSDLLAWFDASDASTVILGTPSPPYGPTDVLRWDDKSGNGCHAPCEFANATYDRATWSIYTNSGVTGNARFSVGGFSSSYNALSSSTWDVAVVGTRDAGDKCLLSDPTGDSWYIFVSSVTDSEQVGAYWNTLGSHAYVSPTLPWPGATLHQIYATIPSASGAEYALDGGTFSPVSGEKLTLSTKPVMMNGGTAAWGKANEFVFTVAGLAADKRAKLQGYIAWKWDRLLGVTTMVSALPSNHPYKLGPPLTGGGDTASISGTVVGDPTGTLAATESGADTAAITGGPLVSGSMSRTETGTDTASVTGGPLVSGSLAATESGSDTASVAGTVLVAGSLAATEAGTDTASIAGGPIVAGPLAATEAAGQDAASIAATAAVSGSLSATEAGQDAASFTGSPLVSGTLSATETGTDSASITGTVDAAGEATGTLSATEIGTDTANVAGDVAVAGSLGAQESGTDTAGLTGTVAVSGALAATESGQDTASIAGGPISAGTLSATETQSDTASITGAALDEITGTLSATESGSDTALILETVPVVELPRGGPALQSGLPIWNSRTKFRGGVEDERRRLEELLAQLNEEVGHGTAGVKPRTRPLTPHLREAHGSGAKTAPRAGDDGRDRALEASRNLVGPSARRIALAAAATAAASEVLAQSRQRRERAIAIEVQRRAEELLAQESRRVRRNRSAALLLASPL